LTSRPLPAVLLALAASASLAQNATQQQVFGYRDFAPQAQIDQKFLAVPDAALAGQHLKTLTAEPHIAGSEEDHKTALYVAEKFKAAGLDTQIVEYKVLLNLPKKILIEAFGPDGKKLMTGPSPEHVGPEYGGDPFQDDPRVTPAFNGASPSGDVTSEVVYANYGTPADFQKLADLGVSVKGKIVLVRYGANYRGIKVYDAQRAGAAGVLIYSDPADDGYFRGDVYPKGPYRPDTAVQRGATQFLPIYPGDATTPGVASTPELPESKRVPMDKIQDNWPSIPVNPLSYHDAAPILQALAGPNVPHEWQGALPFAYHTGQTGDKVTVHMHLEQDTKLRTIWDVIGTIDGTDATQKDDWVVAGNHRDAWVYGAVDPNSGTAAMLETAHGLGTLLKSGWKPKRKVVICSWDAEEEGLIGSTEWVEAHMDQLDHAVAYFNTDVAVSGPNFSAAAVPSLMQFVREVTQDVSSPAGGTVYSQWLKTQTVAPNRRAADEDEDSAIQKDGHKEVRVGTLGSGSDFTPFLQHAGVPSTDIGSGGPYGVYHSVFDNYHWFTKFADPTFVYEQQQARVFGLEILHMADADVLPYDYAVYGKAISGYVTAAANKAKTANLQDDFSVLQSAAARFTAAGSAVRERQVAESGDMAGLNHALRAAEEALLNPAGLPHRDWYKHTIYAPGEFTGYAAVVIPGVNEAIEAKDAARAQTQIDALTSALNKASEILEQAAK
jgi:N-acetylated-alpha-linked acidic dipeptidase